MSLKNWIQQTSILSSEIIKTHRLHLFIPLKKKVYVAVIK